MSSSPNGTTFSAFAEGDLVLVRVVGPGLCKESGRFENLLLEVEARRPGRLLIDLSECPRMDSTFAGALLRFSERAGKGGFHPYVGGARGPVQELIDTLYLGDALPSVTLPDAAELTRVEVSERDMPKEQVMALSLDGHERLAALNPANAARFATLLRVMREQLPPHAPGSGGA